MPLVALLALGLWRLRFNTNVLDLLPAGLPAVSGLQLYQKNFTDSRELILTVRAAEAEQAEAAARQLAETLRENTNLVASVVWKPPWNEHPEQMAELIGYLWLNQPPEQFGEMAHRLGPERMTGVLEEARQELSTSLSPLEIGRLSYDPFGLTRLPQNALGYGPLPGASPDAGFASADGSFRALFVQARGAVENYRASRAWLKEIRQVVDRCRGSADWPKGARVRFTGAVAFVTEISSGMERDVRGSVAATLALIILLFWWAHRSWRPLALLLMVLLLTVAGTLGAGGLLFGQLNVVSLGFAAILLGLAVDYGLVLYQESLAAPGLSAAQIRRVVGPSIGWSAVTTAIAFAMLTWAGLPGLAQLGALVAVGVLLAALAMSYLFLPLANRWKHGKLIAVGVARTARRSRIGPLLLCRAITIVILCASGAVLWRATARVDGSSAPLQPRHSAAQKALDELQTELNRQSDSLLLLVSGHDEAEVARRLDAVEAHLAEAASRRLLRGFKLPTALWPRPDRQRANLQAAQSLIARADALAKAATQAGFTPDALSLAGRILDYWKSAAETSRVLWPTNESCRWLLKRAVAWTGREWLAAGMVDSGSKSVAVEQWAALDPALPGVWLTGWSCLGQVLLGSVEHRLWAVIGVMLIMLLVCLWLAFRRWREVMLSFGTLAFSLLTLLAIMALAGWTWNLMNLMAVPLLLGAGVDYTIHVQLALRRHGLEDLVGMRQVTGRAVFLCAATTVAGFGSNGLSSNAGLASLGLICATGIAITYLSSVVLLPAWWVSLPASVERRPSTAADDSLLAPGPGGPSSNGGIRNTTPSAFYCAGLWRVGLATVRMAPRSLLTGAYIGLAELHFRLRPQRREWVVKNLLPACAGDRQQAERRAHQLYRNFAVKLADLWRVESGVPVDNWITFPGDMEAIQAARRRGQGVVLVTTHLGNWEHGGLLLATLGIRLTVLTLAEPDDRLTELRIASRSRWGIETLIIGQDIFAFVEAIKRLQAGEMLAIAVDRPTGRSDALVELFGRPYRASMAAAELARATGCALLGATILRDKKGYVVKVLPEFAYDRQVLSKREARQALTQEILRAFEPEIRQHLDQWYQFVPVWPEDS